MNTTNNTKVSSATIEDIAKLAPEFLEALGIKITREIDEETELETVRYSFHHRTSRGDWIIFPNLSPEMTLRAFLGKIYHEGYDSGKESAETQIQYTSNLLFSGLIETLGAIGTINERGNYL